MSNDPNGASLGNAQGTITINVGDATASLNAVSASAKQTTDSLAQMGQGADDNAKQATASLGDMQAQAETLGDSIDGVSARGINSIGRLATALGDKGFGNDLRFISEVVRAEQAFGRLSDGLSGIGNSIAALDGPLGALAEKGQEVARALVMGDVAGPISAATAGLGALAAVAVPVVAVIAAVAAGVALLDSEITSEIDVLKQATAANAEYYKAIQDGTTATIQAQLDKAMRDKAIIDAQIADDQARINAIAPPTNLVNFVSVADQAKIDTLNGDITKLTTQSEAAGVTVTGLWNALDSFGVKANDAAAQLKIYYGAIENGTTVSITAEREKQVVIRDTAQAEADALKKKLDANAFAPGGAETTARMQEAQTAADAAQAAIFTLDHALGDAKVAANDAVGALQDKQKVDAEIEQLMKAGNEKAVTDKIASVKESEDANQALIDLIKSNNPDDARLAALQNTRASLQYEYEQLTDNALPYVKSLEAQKAANDEFTRSLTADAKSKDEINKLIDGASLAAFDKQKQLVTDQRANTDQQIQDEKAHIATLVEGTPAYTAATAELAKLNTTFKDQSDQLQGFTAEARAAVGAAQDLKGVAKDLATGFKEVQTAAAQLNAEMLKMTAIQDQEAKLTQTYNDAKTAAQIAENLKLSDEQTAYDTKVLREKLDFYQKQSDADAKFYDQQAIKSRDFYQKADTAQTAENVKIGEETEAFNLQQARRAQDFGAQLVQIEENTRTSVAMAAGRLDAVGVQNALTNGQKQVEAAADTYNKTRDRALQDYQIKIQDEQEQFATTRDQQLQAFLQAQQDALDNYDTQRTQQQDAFNIRLDREQQDYNTRINQETQAFNDQLNARAIAYGQQLTLLQQQQDAEAAIIANSPVVNAFQNMMNGIASAASASASAAAASIPAQIATSVPGLTSYSDINLPTFDLGTNGLGATMPVLAHAQEAIVNPSASVAWAGAGVDLQAGPSQIKGGATFTGDIIINGVNIDGSNLREQMQAVFEEMAL